MFSFHPDSLEDNDFIPNVYITDLSILNKPVYLGDQDGILDSTIEFTRELHLRYSQNIISFTFAALNLYSRKRISMHTNWKVMMKTGSIQMLPSDLPAIPTWMLVNILLKSKQAITMVFGTKLLQNLNSLLHLPSGLRLGSGC